MNNTITYLDLLIWGITILATILITYFLMKPKNKQNDSKQ